MSSDRAAVAREVLTEIANAHRELGFTAIVDVMESWRDEHYPAPAPPETVTVTVGGRVWAREVDGWWVHHSDTSHDVCGPKSTIGEMCARIASDARVIQERDARIAELENELRRALDGAVFHEKRAHHAEQERDAALRALEEVKGEAGATVAASEPLASESPAATSPSPAPIPLGATVEDGEKIVWSWCEHDGVVAWRNVNMLCLRATESSWRECMLTALYHARHDADCNKHKAQHMHDLYDSLGMEWGCNPFPLIQQLLYPVAGRETVERVAKAIDEASRSYSLRAMARAALKAAGFTLEAGA